MIIDYIYNSWRAAVNLYLYFKYDNVYAIIKSSYFISWFCFGKTIPAVLPPLGRTGIKGAILLKTSNILFLKQINLIFPSSLGAWIQCLSSNHHFSYHPTVMHYFYVPRLKHKSFYFITSISYSNSIVVLLSSPRWDHRSSWSVSNPQRFVLFLQFVLHSLHSLLLLP